MVRILRLKQSGKLFLTISLVGLYDQPGAGRRPLLSLDEQQKVQQYLQDSPKDLKKVVHQLEQETGKRVSTKTIKRLIKKNRYVWKRIRKAPAKVPDPHKYERSKVFMNQLQQREAVGDCALWYFDGTGFCLTPCIPYAWQPIGHTIELPVSSHNQRVNVLGFLKRNNEFVPGVYPSWGSDGIAAEMRYAFGVIRHVLQKRSLPDAMPDGQHTSG